MRSGKLDGSSPITSDFAGFGLTFLRPVWLLGLPVALALFWLAARRGSADSWAQAVDPQLLAAMLRRGGAGSGGHSRPWAALVIALLATLALAGPALERAGTAALRNLDAVVLIADLSNRDSSEADLTNLRFVLRRLAASTGTRQVALIVFAGDAYVAGAMTGDPEVTGATIAALEADTVPDPGAVPARALTLALHMLQGSGRAQAVVNADIVLVGSGEGAALPQAGVAAQALAEAGYRLHTLYLAPSALHPDAGLRKAALARLAERGGGHSGAAQAPQALLDELQERPVLRWRAGALAGLAWVDAGRAVLLLAGLAGLALFRRRLA